jgi:hypothetical protein
MRFRNHAIERVSRHVEEFSRGAVLARKTVRSDVAAVGAFPTCVPAAILEEFYYSVFVKPVGKQLVAGG